MARITTELIGFESVEAKVQKAPGVFDAIDFLGQLVHRYDLGGTEIDYYITPCDQIAVVVKDVLLFCTEDASELTGCGCQEVSKALDRVPPRSWLES